MMEKYTLALEGATASLPIYGEIIGSDRSYCEAEGIAVRSPAPVLEHSRGTGFAPYRAVCRASPVRTNQFAALGGRAMTGCAGRRSAHRWGCR
jgi:hypothetical protein